MLEKICDICGDWFEVKRRTQVHCSVKCRVAKSRIMAKSEEAKERKRLYGKLYHQKNKEKISIKRKARYWANKEKEAQYAKDYRTKYPERYKIKVKENYERNKKQKLDYGRKYRKNNLRYFQQTFGKHYGIKPDDVPTELAEVYKKYVQLKREKKNVQANSI